MPDKIDPNDLSSIDALLDEAELDDSANFEAEDVDGVDSIPDDTLELDEITDFDEPEIAAEIDEETVMEEVAEPEEALEPQPIAEPEPVMTDKKSDEALEKRASTRKNNSKKVPEEAEMKEIKKLIIIFSSVIISLAVIGLGIGLWGALSSGGLDEESLEKIDNIEVGVTEGMISSKASNKTIKELEKKLDGLSFLIKELDTDVLAMTNGVADKPLLNLVAKSDQASGHKKEVHNKPPEVKKNEPPQSINLSPEVMKKMDKVSSQMSNTQRRIYEVNKRIKSLQSQYKKLLRSIKSVEKELLKNRIATVKAKPAVKSKDEQNEDDDGMPVEKASMYQYTAPGGMFDSGSDYYR